MAGDNHESGILRIIVERNPPESKLADLNIKCWPKWGCSPGKYQLKFDAEETCYLVKGRVKAYSTKKGSSSSSSSSTSDNISNNNNNNNNDEFVEFGAGDLVTIPKGLSCTWDVSLAVDKFYKFESS